MGFSLFKGRSFKTRAIKYDSEAAVRSALVEICIYVCFLLLTTIVTTSARHLYMYYFNKTINQLFVKRPYFEEYLTTNDFWMFLETTFLEELHYIADNEGGDEATNERIFLKENLLLGPPRLRQIRVRPNTCQVHEAFKNYFRDCYAAYSSGIEDTKATFKGTQFHTLSEVNAVSLWGRIAHYEGAGYIKDLTYNREQNEGILAGLKSNKWIDRGTRVVLVEFGLFNANTDLFLNVKLIAELPPTGGILTSSQAQPVQLYSFWTAGDVFLIVATILFYLMVIYYTLEEVKELRSTNLRSYLSSIWNIVDSIVLISAYLAFIYNIWHPLYMRGMLARIEEQPLVFHSLDVVCFWNLLYMDMMALCVFLVWIKVFKFISFNKTMKQFSTTIGRCAKDLFGFGVMFAIVFLAYAQLGYLLFGSQHPDFRNFIESVLTMMRMVLGDFEYAAMEEAHLVLGPIYFLTYILLVFFILLNMFLAIINDTYTVVKSEIQHGGDHLQLFILKKSRETCACLRAFKNKLLGKAPVAKSVDEEQLAEERDKTTEEPISSERDNTTEEPKSSERDNTTEEPKSSERDNTSGAFRDPLSTSTVYSTTSTPTETKSERRRMRKSDILNQYFEEVPPTPQPDPEELKRLKNRVELLERLLEQLVENMDRILTKVDTKRRSKGE